MNGKGGWVHREGTSIMHGSFCKGKITAKNKMKETHVNGNMGNSSNSENTQKIIKNDVMCRPR